MDIETLKNNIHQELRERDLHISNYQKEILNLSIQFTKIQTVNQALEEKV